MTESFSVSAEDLQLFTLENSRGTKIRFLNFGATVFDLIVRDKNDQPVNVVVGPKNPEDYLSPTYIEENRCFGASVGRYAGRISDGRFEIDGKKYQLTQKNGVHLHGGNRGFQFKLWDLVEQRENSIIFQCFSEDGEEGYPGKLEVRVSYRLNDEDELQIEYTAKTDKATPVNLTNHNYYNLNGKGSISDHEMCIASQAILEVDEKLLPTGNILSLEKHLKDFSSLQPIGIKEIDDTYILEQEGKVALYLAAPQTGIELRVKTNQPSLVVYIPEKLPKLWEYSNSISSFPSVCIEAQNYPDAPNHSNFPEAILRPGEEYRNWSSFKFSVKKANH